MFNTPLWMEWLAFGLSVSGAAAIFSLCAVSLFRRDFQFFPPPEKRSWQYRTFWAFFHLFLYPLVALSILVFESAEDAGAMARQGVGGVLAVTGIGLAFWISIQMGWRNAFGEARGLVTDGWFRFSRNPIYVVTWLGLLGWAIILNDLRVTFLLSLWAAMYWLAPRIEEPWLERQYGDEYCAYKQRTRRFF